MATKLARFSTRLFTNGIRLASLNAVNRKISMFTTVRKLTPIVAVHLKNNLISKYSTNSGNDEKLSRQQIEEKVLDILRNFDRVKENPAKPNVTLESHLTKDLGLDSLDQVEIIVQLEDAFGYEIPDSDYEKLITPVEIVNYLQKRVAAI